jgi:hypothetical protein
VYCVATPGNGNFIEYSCFFSAQSTDNTLKQENLQGAQNIQEGSEAANFARDLSAFVDSAFNTVSQSNEQLNDGLEGDSTAMHTNTILLRAQ